MHPAVNRAPRDPSPSKIPRWLPRDSTTYKPSKLDLMKEEYQRKMLKEKERKIIEMYENNQRKALDRLSRVDGKVNRGNSVRNFFEERRALETNGNKSSMQEIQNHYNRFKKDTSRRSSEPDVPQTIGKRSAGRDRDHPLAPIDKANIPENNILTKPQRFRQHHVSNNNNKNSTLSEKSPPKTIKSKSAPSSGKLKKIDINSMDPTINCEPSVPFRSESDSPPDAAHLSSLKRKNSINRKVISPVSPEESPEKLTDFQKWQLEQVRMKEERLSVHRQRSLGKLSGSEKMDSDEGIDSDRENIEDEIVRKQKELMEKIAQQQADLDKMKLEKEKQAEKERREEEKRQQRATIEREKLVKKEKEKERQRKEAEMERKEEEKRRMMEEKRSSVKEQHKEEENTHYKTQRNVGDTYRHDDYDSTNYRRPHPPATKKTSRPPPRNLAPPEPEEALTPIPGPDVNFYLQAASQDNGGGSIQLKECPICGRRFNVDRLSKHQAACQNSNKKRKVFDPKKMRTQGTEMAQFVNSSKHQEEKPKPKKSDWRIKRDNFIKSIQYAKKVNQIEKQGGNIRDVTPPPPAHNPDYVKCPHCQRSFNQSAAERHIPRCKDINSKPAFNTRRR